MPKRSDVQGGNNTNLNPSQLGLLTSVYFIFASSQLALGALAATSPVAWLLQVTDWRGAWGWLA